MTRLCARQWRLRLQLLGLFILTSGIKASVRLDFVKDCCDGKCGTIDSPLWMDSIGLDQKNDSIEFVHIETSESATNLSSLSDHPGDYPCLIHVYARSSVMMNLSFYENRTTSDHSSVVVMESTYIKLKWDRAGHSEDATSVPRRVHQRPIESGANIRGYVSNSPTEQHKSSVTHFYVNQYRVSAGRQLTIVVPKCHIESRAVYKLIATFTTEEGATGRTFFILLGAVALSFIIGVPVTLVLYRRYRKRKKRKLLEAEEPLQVQYDASKDGARCLAESRPTGRTSDPSSCTGREQRPEIQADPSSDE